MVPADLEYVRRLLAAGVISDPVLELGTGYGGSTCEKLIRAGAIRYYGTDLEAGAGVDFAADFEKAGDMAVFRSVAPFGSLLILNVLEHTFNPVQILDNAITLLRPGGTLVLLTPTIWPLHNYPFDAWRIMPNFYEEYAKRRQLTLLAEWFEYVGYGPVRSYRNEDGSYSFPPPAGSRATHRYGAVLHKLFRTYGRWMQHPPEIAAAVVLRTSDIQLSG
jgi:SAM-dependent methyltransferase